MMSGGLSRRADELAGARVPFVAVTAVRAQHPTSVRPGDSAVVLADGTIEGFVGGACAQSSVRLYASRVLETGEPLLLRLEPGTGSTEDSEGVVVAHNPCLSGGTIELFLEPRLPPPRVVVAGDAPIARALEELGRAAGYDVVRGDPSQLDPQPGDAAVVVASHGIDEEGILAAALERGVGYVALVSSEKRGAAVRDSLDVPPDLRSRLHAPAGLALGARTPVEVAISVLAQLVAESRAQPALSAEIPSTAIDPVCGMEVGVSEATPHLVLDGATVYFCCDGCRSTYAERDAGHRPRARGG
jgi:xanthine dehydrogenase accessory factor